MIRTLSDECCFESFEVLPTNSIIIQNVGRVRRRFPGPAIAIDQHRIADRNFRIQFAQLLACLDSEILERACPIVKKAGSAVGEIRDTVHPMFVTEMLTGMLRAMGRPLEIVRMQKNTRDDVLWKDTLIPWRRSPAWLFLRITLQRSLMLQYKPAKARVWYKSFMLFFMSTILQYAVDAALPSDVVFVMMAKISRRLLKAQIADRTPWLDFVAKAMDQAHHSLSQCWESLQNVPPITRDRKDWHSLRSSFIKDSNLSLLSLEPFIANLRSRTPLSLPRKSAIPNCRSRITQSDHILPNLSSAAVISYGSIHLALADAEK